MRALVYHGPSDVRVTDVDDPRIERPTDVLEHFDKRDTGWTKVVLSPAQTNGGSAR